MMAVCRTSILLLLFLNAAQCSVRWYAIGDWGDPDSAFQAEVAAAMDSYATAFQPEFILTQADNFYPNGITSVQDPEIDTLWREMYNQTNIKDLGWWISVGNHDYGATQGNEWVQVELGEVDPLWNLPHLWYDFTRSDGDVTVHFIVIDTQALSLQVNNFTTMMAWLDDTLNRSTADWVIVNGHHPVYSCGSAGPVVDRFYDDLLPVLEKYSGKLDMYLSGHDHNMQLLQKIGDPAYFDFVISGAGGAEVFGEQPGNEDILNDDYGIGKTFFNGNIGAFAAMEATPDSLTTTFVDQNVNTIFTYSRMK